jgi:hypothetical protein
MVQNIDVGYTNEVSSQIVYFLAKISFFFERLVEKMIQKHSSPINSLTASRLMTCSNKRLFIFIRVNRYNPCYPCSILFGTQITLMNADSRRFFSVCKSSDDLIKNYKFSLQDSHLVTIQIYPRKSVQSALSVFYIIWNADYADECK